MSDDCECGDSSEKNSQRVATSDAGCEHPQRFHWVVDQETEETICALCDDVDLLTLDTA